MGVETPESIPGRAALIPASERAFPITPNPPLHPRGTLRAAIGQPACSGWGAKGLPKWVTTNFRGHSQVSGDCPHLPGRRGFPGHSFLVLKPGTSWADRGG